MDKAVSLAFSEVGGLHEEVVSALMSGSAPNQMFSQCPPSCGTPIAYMNAVKVDDVDIAISKAAGRNVVVEQHLPGERVQIHKLGDCVAIYDKDLRDRARDLSKADMDAML